MIRHYINVRLYIWNCNCLIYVVFKYPLRIGSSLIICYPLLHGYCRWISHKFLRCSGSKSLKASVCPVWVLAKRCHVFFHGTHVLVLEVLSEIDFWLVCDPRSIIFIAWLGEMGTISYFVGLLKQSINNCGLGCLFLNPYLRPHHWTCSEDYLALVLNHCEHLLLTGNQRSHLFFWLERRMFILIIKQYWQ